MKRLLTIFCAVVLSLVVASCATPSSEVRDIQPGERPALASDEAGLWMYMEDMERRLATSGRVINDPALNDYIRDVLCRLAPAYCSDIRFYVVRTPHFNASMAPNGFMQIWSGLILRAQNEAQLAYILGHELAHYQRRHSVQQWRNIRGKSGALIYFQIATGAAGVGAAGDVAALVTLASLFAYSREHEREADEVGFQLLTAAGYDPREAATMWEIVMEEQEAAGDTGRLIWFATHPASEERAETLRALAAEATASGETGVTREDEFLAAVRPFRRRFLRDELGKRNYAASEVVIQNLLDLDDDKGELHFFQGELYRMRAQEGDPQKAIASYRMALKSGDAPPELHRSLGLMYWRTGQLTEAKSSFDNYLHLLPDAPDYLMIRAYRNELE